MRLRVLLDRPVARYLLAAGLVAAAMLLRVALTRVTGELPPFVISFPTVALVALLLGAGPGVLATLLAALVTDYFFLKPMHTFGLASLSEAVALGLFVSGGLLISLMAGRVVRARRREAEAAERARGVESLQQVERCLRESEERFRALAEGTTVLLWINGPEGCRFANRAYLEFLGVATPEDVQRYDWTQFVHPEDREGYIRAYQDCVQRRAPFEATFRFRRHDGVYRWMQSSALPRFSDSGELLCYIGSTVDVTERKAAEAQVRLQAAALEAAPNAISISETDREGTIVWVNRAFTTLTGYSAEEAIGHSHHLLSSGRQSEEFYAKLWATIERGEVWRGELVNRRKNGTLYEDEMGITPLRDEQGRITHYVAVKQDITARKQAEEALRESERQLRFVCESIPHLVWAARPDGHIDFLNQRVLDYTGASHDQMLGWDWLPFVHPEDRQQTADYWRSALRDGTEVRLNYRLRHGQSGEYRWHAVHALPLRANEGRIVRWYGTCTDIDEQKRAEEALRQSEARLTLAQEAARIGAFQWDVQTGVNLWTPQLEAMYGLAPGEFGKTESAWEQLVHPEDRAAAIAVVDLALETGQPVEGEWRVIWRDGSVHWIMGRFQAAKDAEGKPLRLSGVNIDITERKRAEEALRLSEEKFAAAFTGSPAAMTLTVLEDGRFLDVNDTWMALNGYSREEVMSPSANATMFWPTPEARARFVQELRERGSLSGWEQELRKRSGELFIAQLSAQVLNLAGEQLVLSSYVDITARKQAEAALHESEAQFRDLAEAMPQLVWIARPDGYHEYFNTGCHDYLGMSFDQLAGTGWLNCLHPDDRQRTLDRWNHSLRTVEPYEIEYRLRRASDGAYRWFLGRALPVHDEEGRITRWFGTSTDIDDQKRAEERLEQRVRQRTMDLAKALAEVHESEQRFRTMADAIPQLAWIANADGWIHWYNRRWYEYTGTTPQQMEGWGWQSVHDPKTLPAVLERWKASIATGEPFEMTFPLRGADGVFRPFLTRVQPLRNEQGQVVQWFGTNTDVDELKRAQEIARESESNLQNFLNTAATGLVLNSRDLHYLSVNPAYAEIAGRPVEQIIGYSLGEVLGEQALARIRPYIERVLAGERVEYETELPFAGTGPRWIHAVYTPDRDGTGKVVGWVGSITDITKRKQAEEALRESEKLYRAVGESIDYGIWICDAQGRNTYASDSLLKLVGITREQCADFGWGEVLHPEDREATIAAWKECVQRGATWYREHRYRGVDGQYHPILACGVPVRNEQGEVTAWVGINLDISRLKRTEQALRDSEQRLMLAQQAARIGAFEWNVQTDMNTWTPELEAMYGLTLGAFGKTESAWEQLVHPEDRAAILERVQEAFKTGEPAEKEWRVIWPDGSVHWIMGRFQVFKDAQGAPQRLSGVNIDITERKRAEAELGRKEAELREAQRVAHVGNWYWDAKTDATTGSDELLRLYGFDPATQAMPDFEDQRERCYPAEDWEKINAAVQRALQTGEGYELDVRVLRCGTAIWATTRGEVVRDAEGRIVGLRGTVQDITERKQAEEMTAARQVAELARAAAEQANQAKDHFLAVLSHELRTPLTPVLPALEELARQVSEEAREDVEMARRNVELEARLIDDLLDVTRIARGKIELHRESVELYTVMRRAAEVCAPDIEARRLHFGIKVEGGPYAVEADPARLQQVFWNLIKNAIKFTPHGGCVGIHCQSRDGQVVAQVKDSGMGIEPAALARIFNAFEQVDRSVTRQFGGLGLGLAICKALVELHGGTITAESDGKGKGAIFTVKLPILKVAEGGMKAPEAGGSARTVAVVSRPLDILLVEDHGDTARILRRMLQNRGHRVETAGDVATALERAQEKAFDLLLSDLGLPDGNGVELMRQLRQQGQMVPGIALSGYGQEEDIRRSKEAGFAEHLTKPVNVGQLEAAIGRVAMG